MVLVLGTGTAGYPTTAQDISSLEQNPFDASGLPPLLDTAANSSAPRLAFSLLGRVELPSTRAEIAPRLLSDAVHIAGPEGWLRVEATTEGFVLQPAHGVAQAATIDEPPESVEAADGAFRLRPLSDGWLIAERRCARCAKGWKRAWRLRTPGRGMASPVIIDDLVVFAAADNRVYGVQRTNGHRRWVADVNGRATPPLSVWHAPERQPHERSAVLVAIDGGAELLALDTRSGRTLATLKPPDVQSRLRPGPLVLDDGRVAIIVENYGGEATLAVYRLDALTDTVVSSATRSSLPPQGRP